jgi:tetratricopeptide (TPR) repeat protein
METIAELFAQAQRFEQSGHRPQAEALYRQILLASPTHADAHHALGLLAHQEGHTEAAVTWIRQAIVLDPWPAVYHYHLGILLMAQRRSAEAVEAYRQAVSLDPQFVEALRNLGVVLKEQGQVTEAIECYRQALRVNPLHVAVLGNLGVALLDQGQRKEAAACFDQALQLAPEDVPTRYNCSMLRLLNGDFENGWPGYELRWKLPGKDSRTFPQPFWDGTSLEGKTILLYAEQGFGDTIHFIRYASLLRQRGGTVLFECPPVLRELLAGVAGVDRLLTPGEGLPPFDVRALLVSLPGLFCTTLATIPAQVPYLSADPERIAHWRKELEPLQGFKVGIVWQGSRIHKNDRQRSVPLTEFGPLSRVEGVRLFSLQVGPGMEQLGAPGAPSGVIDLGSRFDRGSFADAAAVLKNLDLLITVDTALAHLAGALAVPVWVALPFLPDWRWMLDRPDSPWYPTMRLFRRTQPGRWGDVFRSMAAALGDLAQARKRR